MASNSEQMTALLEKVTVALRERFPEGVIGAETGSDMPTLALESGVIVPAIAFLKNDASMGFQYLTTLCGIHYPDQHKIAVMYQLHNLVTNDRVRLKTFLSEENPEIASLTTVFPAANWMERETYDFFGVKFLGHPNLKRILNVEDMIIFPLRKEYPLEDQVRSDKNDKMFGR